MINFFTEGSNSRISTIEKKIGVKVRMREYGSEQGHSPTTFSYRFLMLFKHDLFYKDNIKILQREGV